MRLALLILFLPLLLMAQAPPIQRNIFTTNTNPYLEVTGNGSVTSNRNTGRWTIVVSGSSDAITNVSDAANAGISLIYTSNNFTIKLVTFTAGANIWITNNGTNLVIAGPSTNGFVTQTITNGLATITYVNSATNTLAQNIALSLSNKVDELNGVATNLIANGLTNIGPFTSTQAVMSFGNTGNHVVLRQATDFDGAEFYAEDAANIFLKIRSGGALDFPLLSPFTVLRLGVAGNSVSSIANASGALTNNGSGGVGYYNGFLTSTATNDFANKVDENSGVATNLNTFGVTNNGPVNFSGNFTNHALTASKLKRTDSGKREVSSTYDETDFALAATTNSFRTTVASNGTILALATNVDFHNFPRITNANGNISIGNDLSTITNIATNAIDLLVGQGVGNLTLLVKSNKTLYGFGDSQTAGNNATNAYYTSGGYLLPQYRWLSLLASNNQKGLAISNWGIPGGRILMDLTVSPPKTIFNSMGRLTNTWQGVVAIMAGWNDLGNETTDPSLFEALQHSYEAMIARALIDDYFAISYLGFTRTSFGGNDTPGWSTGVTVNEQITTSDEDSIPFPFSVGSSARYYIALTGTNGIKFTFQSKRAGALFFDTDVNSGSASVLVNGVKYGDFNLIYGQGPAYRFPYVIWLNNLPDNAVVTITNNLAANKTNFWLAAGYVNDFRQVPNRTVIIGPTTANSYCGGCTPAATQRDNTNLFALMKSGEVTAAAIGDLGFPVYFANPYNGYVPQTDPEPADPAHFTPEGNLHIAQAFLGAVRASGYKSSNVITLPNFPELSISSNNVVLATAVTNLDFYGVNSFTQANGKVSIGFGGNGSTLNTNWISGKLYTNNSGSIIHVESGVNLVGAAVNGAATMLLMYDPAGGSSYTLLKPDSLTTVVTGFAVNITNGLSGDIPSGGSFYFTNLSVGAGDSATLVTGTGTRTVISVDPSSHVAANNGVETNISIYAGSTTTVPQTVFLAGGHRTNASSIFSGPAITGGFDSNSIPFWAVSNSASQYPSVGTLFVQTNDLIVTNITTSLTTVIGSGKGSLTLPAGFWQPGRAVKIEGYGRLWTPASPGNFYMQVSFGGTVIATNFSLTALTASLVNNSFTFNLVVTCRTNTSTGYLEVDGALNPATTAASDATIGSRWIRNNLTLVNTTATGAFDIQVTNGAATTAYHWKTFISTALP